MSKPRYLTKSRYKIGLECPTKLFYTNKKTYPDTKMDDPFMNALAQGGYQVGELAKHYFPGGHDITTLDYDDALAQTNTLLQRENIIIYEPAIRFKDLFIRIDILVKEGNHFNLIEVKAKSIDTKDVSPFFGKQGALKSGWKAYLFDVAFQHYVLQGLFPSSSISCSLMLADKHAVCQTNQLNQKFKIHRDNNHKSVSVSDCLTNEDLKNKILVQIPVDDEVKYIYQHVHDDGKSFIDNINFLANRYKNDIKIPPNVGSHCKKCEFNCSIEDEIIGLKSGFKECWREAKKWTEKDFQEPNLFDLWNFRGIQGFIDEDRIKFSDLVEEDFNIKKDCKPGLSTSDRQWLQIEMARADETDAYLDIHGMKSEMACWVYPLHFIDFETTTVALPFTKGRKPYEGIAFQFSHHVMHEDGRVEHVGQYLNTGRGNFPNYDFIRNLKSQLQQDDGTIFRYGDHENNYLNLIIKQIDAEKDAIEDAEELIRFIKTITHSSGEMKPSWKGDRDMIDLLYLVKRFYYHPAMKGSNSLKYVLPAVLSSSTFLQSKYNKPIYGAKTGIPSLNFTDHTWLKIEDGKVIDPYKQLPPLFTDVSEKNIKLLFEEDALSNGGAAMMAYAKIQFEEMSEYERNALENGLLKYCELDTLAMVMLIEAWQAIINERDY